MILRMILPVLHDIRYGIHMANDLTTHDMLPKVPGAADLACRHLRLDLSRAPGVRRYCTYG